MTQKIKVTFILHFTNLMTQKITVTFILHFTNLMTQKVKVTFILHFTNLMTQKVKVTFIPHFTNLMTQKVKVAFILHFTNLMTLKGKDYLYSAFFKFDDTKGKGYLSQSAQANSNNRNWASLVLSCEVRHDLSLVSGPIDGSWGIILLAGKERWSWLQVTVSRTFVCHGLVSLLLALCGKADHDHFIVVFTPVTMTGFFWWYYCHLCTSDQCIVVYPPLTMTILL